MYVLTLVLILTACCVLLAAVQDTLCISRTGVQLHDGELIMERQKAQCAAAMELPIVISASMIVALMAWSAWGKQVHL